MPEELWAEIHNIVQEAANKTIPKEKKSKKAKLLSEEALQIAEERHEKQGRKVKVDPTKFQRIARTDKKASFKKQCKETDENHRREKDQRSLQEN